MFHLQNIPFVDKWASYVCIYFTNLYLKIWLTDMDLAKSPLQMDLAKNFVNTG